MSLKSKSVLVTGGAGFIGSHLVDRIAGENPKTLIVVDNFFLGAESNLSEAKKINPDLEIIRLDASNLAAMQDVVTKFGIDTVFDLAVVPLPTSLDYPEYTIRTNIGIASTFCEISRLGLIERYIHMSSSEAYGSARYVPMDEGHPFDAITPYAASKAAEDSIIDSYVQTFGIDATIVRPFNNYGPRQNPGSYAGIIPVVIQRASKGTPIEIHGDGEQTRDFTFVKDTAKYTIDVYNTPEARGKVINVATGVGTSINELVRRILEIMGKPNHEVIHTAPRPGDVRKHQADSSLLKSLVGGQPAVLTDEALTETVDYYLRTQ